jgi:hypothetical protein
MISSEGTGFDDNSVEITRSYVYCLIKFGRFKQMKKAIMREHISLLVSGGST